MNTKHSNKEQVMTITPEELVNELKRLWELLPEDLDQVAGGWAGVARLPNTDSPSTSTLGYSPSTSDIDVYQTDGGSR